MEASVVDIFGPKWLATGHTFGFRVSAPFQVTLPDGRSFTAPVLLPDFGATNGMLLFPHYELLEPFAKAVVEAGYGYSVLSEPTSTEPYTSMLCALRDWGWSGAASDTPEWLREA